MHLIEYVPTIAPFVYNMSFQLSKCTQELFANSSLAKNNNIRPH